MTGTGHPEDDTPEEAWSSYRMDPDERPTEAVSALKNAPVLELGPLSSSVDTDALDALFSGPKKRRSDLRVEFTYAGCVVEVTNPLIRVRDRE